MVKDLVLAKEVSRKGVSEKAVSLVTFYLGDMLFGVYAESVIEINKDLEITPVPLADSYILGIMNLRGQILTVIDLAKRINFKVKSSEINSRFNLIVREQDEVVSFLIERVGDIIEVPVFKLEDPPERIEGFDREYVEKIYQLSDKLLVILNLRKLFID